MMSNGRVEGAKSDAALVEVEDDEVVTAAQVGEAPRQVGSIGRGAGDVILEHAFAAGGVQRIELANEDSAAFGGGDAGVSGEAHGMCPQKNPLPPHFVARSFLWDCRDENWANQGLWNGLRAGPGKCVFVGIGPTSRCLDRWCIVPPERVDPAVSMWNTITLASYDKTGGWALHLEPTRFAVALSVCARASPWPCFSLVAGG